MARPKKQRIIEANPNIKVFYPQTLNPDKAEKVEIGLDELEALRLTNIEQLSQEETASRMGISRQLVGLMLSSARKKITQALLEGKSIILK